MVLIKLKTLLNLGLLNVVRAACYRVAIKFKLSYISAIPSENVTGVFFHDNLPRFLDLEPNKSWIEHSYIFGRKFKRNTIPNWNENYLTGGFVVFDEPWYCLNDFSFGDIKGVWEASRFDWLICFAQFCRSGQRNMIDELNDWLSNWHSHNPPFMGLNWKCGQEASLRVLNLSTAALILGQTQTTSPTLLNFVMNHLRRIEPTISYAISQDNNHATSEAAALYIGGGWLTLNGIDQGEKWHKLGAQLLERSAGRLILDDGSFSQHSVTYHRVMLDTFSLVEVWRLRHELPRFSEKLYKKLSSSSLWLYYFTNAETGDAPNIGANDGARLIPLTSTDYRDFRPSVQLANVLFNDALAYEKEGEFSLPLLWFQIKLPRTKLSEKVSKDFPDGGYCYMQQAGIELFLNYPKFKFRPSQCDALHLDLWINGINVFRDGGTYSYNAGDNYINYYGGVQSHCTVEFDGHDQMPRLSRFLLGDWLKVRKKQALTNGKESCSFSISYRDRFNCSHQRGIELFSNKLVVTDKLSGFQKSAVSRLRLAPIEWRLVNNTLVGEHCSIIINSNVSIKRLELSSGKESRYYYQESDIPVLEIEIQEAGIITTEVKF